MAILIGFRNEKEICDEFAVDGIPGVLIFACYEQQYERGEAEILYVSNGKWFHVAGSHCSCYGLEDQFEPEEMPFEAIQHLMDEGNGLLSQYSDRLNPVFEALDVAGALQGPPERLQTLVRLMA